MGVISVDFIGMDSLILCSHWKFVFISSLYRSPLLEWVPSLVSSFPFCCIGYLLGGHVMRLFHGHDEVLTIPGSDQSEEQQR